MSAQAVPAERSIKIQYREDARGLTERPTGLEASSILAASTIMQLVARWNNFATPVVTPLKGVCLVEGFQDEMRLLQSQNGL